MGDIGDPIAQYRAHLDKTIAALKAGLENERRREQLIRSRSPSRARGGSLRGVRAQIRWYERHIAEWERGRIK